MRSDWKLSKVFYGWWIVSACFLTSVIISGIAIYGFTAFFEPIQEEFGWSYTQISVAASIRGVEVGLLAPLVGVLLDRGGPRRIMFGGAIISGLSLILLSRTNSLGIFYGAFVLMAIGISGSSPTVMVTAVANWFRKKVGIATGITVSGMALGGILLPLIVKLIDLFDWRNALFIAGLAVWVIAVPLSLLVRHKPEQYGYRVDGEEGNTITPYDGSTPARSVEVSIGAKQALKSRPFWHVVLSMVCNFIVVTAVIVHIMPYLSSVGIARSTSSLATMTVALASAGGRLGSGWLGDKYDKRRVATGCFAITGLGLLCFTYTSDERMWLLVPFIILFGIGYGGNNTMRAALLVEYFGRGKIGTIYGFMMGMLALSGIAGPVFAGWIFDTRGSYYVALITFVGLIFVALIIMATAPPAGTNVQSADKT